MPRGHAAYLGLVENFKGIGLLSTLVLCFVDNGKVSVL